MRLGTQRGRETETPGGIEGAWWTPPPLARKVVRWMGFGPGDRVIDAGAGRGALALEVAHVGAHCVAVERDRVSLRFLRMLAKSDARIEACEHDFLTFDRPGYDATISNPVWEEEAPDRFALHALELAPRAGLIVPLNLLAGVRKETGLWHRVKPTRIAICERRPNFDPDNDGGQRDCMVVEVVRRTG